MKCSCCDRFLNDFESTLKHAEYEHYLDTCMSCLEDLNIPYLGRDDLNPFDVSGDEDWYEEPPEDEE